MNIVQIRLRKSFIVKSICVFTLVIFFMSSNAYGETEKAPSQYIVLSSNAGKHLSGQGVTISGEYFNSNNEFLDEAITIKYFDTQTDRQNVDTLLTNTVYS